MLLEVWTTGSTSSAGEGNARLCFDRCLGSLEATWRLRLSLSRSISGGKIFAERDKKGRFEDSLSHVD